MKKQKLFYGWYVVAACFIMLAASVGIAWNCVSQFIKPICDDLGYNRAQVAVIQTILYGVNLVMALLAGKIYKTFSIAGMLKFGTFLLPLAWVGFSRGNSLMWLYACSAIATVGIFCTSLMSVSMILGNWFHQKIGTIIGLTFMGTGFGGMVFNSVTGVLLEKFGWRVSFAILAAIMFVLIFPCTFFVIKVTPQEMGLTPYGQKEQTETAALTGLTFAQTLKTPKFWFICLALALSNIPSNNLMQTVAPHLSDVGYSMTFAANMAAVAMGSLAVGKFLLGIIIDKTGMRISALLVNGCVLVSLLGLFFAQSMPMLIIYLIFSGLACSFSTVAGPIIATRYLGTRDYSALYGLVGAASSVGGVLAPLVANGIYEMAGTYNLAYILGCVVSVAVAVILFFFFAPKHEAK